MMAYNLKLIQPKELPATGVTYAQFKPWINHVKNFLQQDVENCRFLPGGEYQEWKPATDVLANKRIDTVHNDDEEKADIDDEVDAATKERKRKKLLLKRNAQLSKMIQHVVSFVHYTEADDIDQSSTSMEWIFKYLRQHYNIEAKGANFLKITEHSYKPDMQPQVFYKQFRASFINNLRKTGEIMTHKAGKQMTEDETLSPSFEDAIVLWSLEKIDPRLPKKVRKDYEHRLTGSTYLIDLQVTIFQSIPSMLEDLDRQAEINALTTTTSQPDTSLNAFKTYGGRGNNSYNSRGGRGKGSGRGSDQRAFSEKFCRVCHSTGKPANVFRSHNVGSCGFFNSKDRRDMFTSLKAMNLDDDEDETVWTVDREDLEIAEGVNGDENQE